ncbi:MAG: hypothetical protein OQK82_02745, partial [Candidatus Pacearchaeota archaeon]|nr:hypothetical protein [Candidatus Pacearchaeota archaeon]
FFQYHICAPIEEINSMKEVVNEILTAEKACERILQDARQKALAIRQESEKEASALISAAQEDARNILQNAVNEARKQALREREDVFAEISTYKADLMVQKKDTIDMLVETISAMLLASPNGKEQRS